MLSAEFHTKQGAQQAGYIFIGPKVIDYKTDAEGRRCKVQRADVSKGASFGYKFSLAAYRQTDQGWQKVGLFGKTKELYISEAENISGGKGAYFANAMLKTDYESALTEAWRALGCEIVSEENRLYQTDSGLGGTFTVKIIDPEIKKPAVAPENMIDPVYVEVVSNGWEGFRFWADRPNLMPENS